jgi:hypothetical protein
MVVRGVYMSLVVVARPIVRRHGTILPRCRQLHISIAVDNSDLQDFVGQNAVGF